MTLTPPASATNTPTRAPRSPSSPTMDIDTTADTSQPSSGRTSTGPSSHPSPPGSPKPASPTSGDEARTTQAPPQPKKHETQTRMYDAAHVQRWNRDLGDVFVGRKTKA